MRIDPFHYEFLLKMQEERYQLELRQMEAQARRRDLEAMPTLFPGCIDVEAEVVYQPFPTTNAEEWKPYILPKSSPGSSIPLPAPNTESNTRISAPLV